MEGYIANTQAFLGMIQAVLTDEEFKKSCASGEEMYKLFSEIAERDGLTMREMLNAVLSINMGVLEIMQEQLKDMKGEE